MASNILEELATTIFKFQVHESHTYKYTPNSNIQWSDLCIYFSFKCCILIPRTKNYLHVKINCHTLSVDPMIHTMSFHPKRVNEKFKLTYKALRTLLSYLHAKCPWSVRLITVTFNSNMSTFVKFLICSTTVFTPRILPWRTLVTLNSFTCNNFPQHTLARASCWTFKTNITFTELSIYKNCTETTNELHSADIGYSTIPITKLTDSIKSQLKFKRVTYLTITGTRVGILHSIMQQTSKCAPFLHLNSILLYFPRTGYSLLLRLRTWLLCILG